MSTRTISESEYQSLIYARDKLQALEEMGVDNWDGYADAKKLLNSWYSDIPVQKVDNE